MTSPILDRSVPTSGKPKENLILWHTKMRTHLDEGCKAVIKDLYTAREASSTLEKNYDQGSSHTLAEKAVKLVQTPWIDSYNFRTYTKKFRELYIPLQGTDYALNDKVLLIRILQTSLPDEYNYLKSKIDDKGFETYLEALNYLDKQDSLRSFTGSNASGQALRIEGVRGRNSNQNLRGSGNGPNCGRSPYSRNRGFGRGYGRSSSYSPAGRGRGSSRSPAGIGDILCNYCRNLGHRERHCQIRKADVDNGWAIYSPRHNGMINIPAGGRFPP